MIEPERLNPKDVLDHLNSLGYHITQQQLKEFLHDLKKLIKYDQKQTLKSCEQLESSNSNSCDYEYTCYRQNNASETSSDKSYDPVSISESSHSNTYKKQDSLKTDSLNKYNFRSARNSEKVPSSFIRPWHISVCNSLSTRCKKNPDPVKLYHQYKETWNKLNIPGESKHSQLRWVIRNKMLGQKPQPRVFI